MNIKRILSFMAFVLAFAVSAGAEDLDAKYATELLQPGAAAPDFTLNDINGKSYQFSSFKGKYVVLDFWASWCPDCRNDIPELKRLHDLYGDKVQFIGISFDDKKENWEKCVESNNLDWIHLSELKKWKETDISNAYHIKWLPTTYIIDDKGNVVLSTVMIDKVAAKLEELSK